MRPKSTSRRKPPTSPSKSRKIRSIRHVTSRFCAKFPSLVQDGESWEVSVESVVKGLNASKGSVYEVFHVLEALLIVSKIGRNLYRWNGFGSIRVVLAYLRRISLKLLDMPTKITIVKESEVTALLMKSAMGQQNQPKEEISKVINRETIHILEACQMFIMVFLIIPRPKVITLDFATKIVYGANLSHRSFLSRTRRLYDIANVLCATSIPIIKKVQIVESRGKRTAFQYIGPDPGDFEPTPGDILGLPDYRRKHLYFSRGKVLYGLQELPESAELPCLSGVRLRSDTGVEIPMVTPGLDVVKIAIEHWDSQYFDLSTVEAIEKVNFYNEHGNILCKKRNQPNNNEKSSLFVTTDGKEIDPLLVIRPGVESVMPVVREKIQRRIKRKETRGRPFGSSNKRHNKNEEECGSI